VPAFKDPPYPVAATEYKLVYFLVIVAERYVDISGQCHSKFWHYQQRPSTECRHAGYWRSLYTMLALYMHFADCLIDLIDLIMKYNLKQSEWLTSPLGTEWSVVTEQAVGSTFLILVYILAVYLRTLSEAQTLKQGCPTFPGKGPQLLLWAGSRAAPIKFTVSGMP
jgi:hypothetical protein